MSALSSRFARKVAAPALGVGLIGAAAFGFAATANANDDMTARSGPSSVDLTPKGDLYIVNLGGSAALVDL